MIQYVGCDPVTQKEAMAAPGTESNSLHTAKRASDPVVDADRAQLTY